MAIGRFGLEPPVTLYYPGSSTDASLTGIEGVHVIHVDQLLDSEAINGFRALGATAIKADVHSWTPPKPVEVVAFVNPTGIDAPRVLDNTSLKAGGLVLWASTGLPHSLQEHPDVALKAVVEADEAGRLSVDTEDLDDYFNPKQFDDLTADEAENFREKLHQYLAQRNLSDPRALDETYRLLQLPENLYVAFEIGYHFPHKKTGTYFIYQR